MIKNIIQALSAVKKDGLALEQVPDHLKSNAVETAAVAQNSDAIKFTRNAAVTPVDAPSMVSLNEEQPSEPQVDNPDSQGQEEEEPTTKVKKNFRR